MLISCKISIFKILNLYLLRSKINCFESIPMQFLNFNKLEGGAWGEGTVKVPLEIL